MLWSHLFFYLFIAVFFLVVFLFVSLYTSLLLFCVCVSVCCVKFLAISLYFSFFFFIYILSSCSTLLLSTLLRPRYEPTLNNHSLLRYPPTTRVGYEKKISMQDTFSAAECHDFGFICNSFCALCNQLKQVPKVNKQIESVFLSFWSRPVPHRMLSS